MANYLIEPLRAIFGVHTGPYRLFELIEKLQAQHYLEEYKLSDTEGLFAINFLVNNALYQLQSDYWQEDQRYLSISSLAVELMPYSSSNSNQLSNASEDQALSEYYLDWTHLEQASKESVEALLNSFWQAFVSDEDLLQALELFDLPADCKYSQVKKRYRELAMQHHPDRGGSEEHFQALNHAMSILQKRYTHCDSAK